MRRATALLLIVGGIVMTTAGMGGLSALAQLRRGAASAVAPTAPDLALAGAADAVHEVIPASQDESLPGGQRRAAPARIAPARPASGNRAPGAPRRAAHPNQARRAHTAVQDRAQRKITPGEFSMSLADPTQQQVLALVNQDRRAGGCGTVALDRRLIVSAYGHAADMARHGYFAHESPAGTGSSDRMWAAGFHWSRYGENIARGPDSVAEVVDGWMNSPAHRENIMDCRLQEMGIGVAVAWDGTPYWVQDFATPQ